MRPEVVGAFHKSSYSDQQGDCVEVAHASDGGRVVRDSKNSACGVQFYAPHAWGAFMKAIGNGHLPAR